MPKLELHTPEGITLTREIAGAGSRFAAALFDALLIIGGYLLVVLVAALAVSFDPTGASALVLGILAGGVVLVFVLYSFVFHALWSGQTPGKRLLGLRVASSDGYPASAMQNMLRSLLWPVDVLLPVPAPFGWLGLILIALTEQRQRLGDIVAGTLVVREPSEPSAARDAREVASALEVPSTLPSGLAARLTSDDFEFVTALLSRTGLKLAEERKLFDDAVRFYAERLELAPPREAADARAFLVQVHALMRTSRAARA